MNKSQKTIWHLVTYSSVFFAASGYGSLLGDAFNVVTAPVTAPTKVIVNTGKAITGNGSAGQILQPYKDLGNSAGNILSDGINVAAKPQEFLYNEVQKAAKEVGGPTEFIFDVSTFTQRYNDELVKSGGQATANLLRQQNPLQIIAAPLAAALRAAEERHSANAKALPDEAKSLLAGQFPDQILNNARYTVGKVEITMPNFIGKFMQSEGYAVTVGNIIVFNEEPPSIKANPEWWSHELTHVVQYSNMGFEQFAYRYLVDYAGLENEARANGNRIAVALQREGKLSPIAAAPYATGSSETVLTAQTQPGPFFRRLVFRMHHLKASWRFRRSGMSQGVSSFRKRAQLPF